MWWVVMLALVVCVGATNIYNFMDGINGIMGGYSLAILIPLLLMNGGTGVAGEHAEPVIDGSFLVVAILSVLLFCIGKLVLTKADVTWLLMLIVYGVDGCLTIVHRKHAYQLMANELHLSHVTVSLLYMGLQLLISLVFIYLIPDTALAHWIYLVCVILLLSLAYVWLTFGRACSRSAMLKQAWTLLSLTRSLHEEVLPSA